MADYTFVKGARWPSIYGTAEAPAGTPVDISGKTVTFVMTLVGETEPALEVTASVVSGVAGTMKYDWAADQPPAVGHYLAVWKVELSSGITGVFPSDGPLTIDVLNDVAEPTVVPSGYTSPQQVAAMLGTEFTPAQNAHCLELIASAEEWIDQYTHRTWKADTTITDELHELTGRIVRLDRAPIASVSAVKVRSREVGAEVTTLSASEYEIVATQQGMLALAIDYWNSYALVTYLPAVTVPADVRHAATLLVAHEMSPQLSPDTAGLKSYSVGGELQVTFADREQVMAQVTNWLSGRGRLVFA